MQDRLIFVISPPRAGSTLLSRMLSAHSQIASCPEPHLITPLAFLGYYDLVDKAPYDHVNSAEAIKSFVTALPRGEQDYLDALRAYSNTLYGRMLEPSGKRYLLDKTPAYALVLPFLTRLYPEAHYIVLTRHPLAVASAYADSFFDGNWEAANDFDPVVNRYVPAIARLLHTPPRHLLQVGYEQLVREPDAELARAFDFLGLAHEPVRLNEHGRPLDEWRAELAADPRKRELASAIVSLLEAADVRAWGFDKPELLDAIRATASAETAQRATPRKPSGSVLQRRLLLALKKDIHKRPHGKLLEQVRRYCNALLRE